MVSPRVASCSTHRFTGKAMPTGVRRDSSGFEDVNEFFRSPETQRNNASTNSLMAATTSIHGGTSAVKSRRMTSHRTPASVSKRGETSTRSRFGGLGDEDEDEELAGDVLDGLGGLLDADAGLGSGEMSMDVETQASSKLDQ
jgi:hypothetical protein